VTRETVERHATIGCTWGYGRCCRVVLGDVRGCEHGDPVSGPNGPRSNEVGEHKATFVPLS
jgi:hypothetical protein